MATNSLVSYDAPSASNVTFTSPILTLQLHGTASTFAGAASTTGQVSYPDAVNVSNVSASTASTWFQFYTVPANDSDNTTGNDIVGVNSSTVPVFTSSKQRCK